MKYEGIKHEVSEHWCHYSLLLNCKISRCVINTLIWGIIAKKECSSKYFLYTGTWANISTSKFFNPQYQQHVQLLTIPQFKLIVFMTQYTKYKNIRSCCCYFVKYVADPAIFLASNSVLGTLCPSEHSLFFHLWGKLFLSLRYYLKFQNCGFNFLYPKLHSCPLTYGQTKNENGWWHINSIAAAWDWQTLLQVDKDVFSNDRFSTGIY